MPAKNRPVVGHVECNACHKPATVHVVAKGTREGDLYIRGCECVCNQSSGKFLQDYWRANAKPLSGYEHLFPGKGDQPDTQGDQPGDQETDESPETAQEPRSAGNDQVKATRSKTPLFILGGLTVAGVVAAIIGLKK